LGLSARKKHHLKQFSTSVYFPEQNVDIDPYLLGVWLGDGSSNAHAGFQITNMDDEVVDHCMAIASSMNMEFKLVKPKARTQ
ncbi:hypothetical protein, partial [Streptococcus pneumoniae]|uniref:hypothetical protein n=1 Tax=Streptococcus pneumoniae TaxID=1313 RepID=UPI001E2ACCC8